MGKQGGVNTYGANQGLFEQPTNDIPRMMRITTLGVDIMTHAEPAMGSEKAVPCDWAHQSSNTWLDPVPPVAAGPMDHSGISPQGQMPVQRAKQLGRRVPTRYLV